MTKDLENEVIENEQNTPENSGVNVETENSENVEDEMQDKISQLKDVFDGLTVEQVESEIERVREQIKQWNSYLKQLSKIKRIL